MLDKELIENRALTEHACAMHEPYPEIIGEGEGSISVRTGAVVRQDGSVAFRVYAPEAKEAYVTLTSFADVKVELEKDESGVFFGVLPYEERLRGPQDVKFWLDGTMYLHPRMPAHFRSYNLVNVVEIPDPESEMILLRDVPHGQVVREVYYSHAFGTWMRCMVYLPPQYRKGGEYPVLYLQHGMTENESEWIYMGKMPYIMDNLIADGKAQPFIVVTNDGMQRNPGEGAVDFGSFESTLIDDCIPFIEENYRVKTDKHSRAFAGLSMGSMMSSVIGLSHPELFGSLGLFSGFMRTWMNPDPDFAQHKHLQPIVEDPQYIAKNYDLFFRSIGSEDKLKPVYDGDTAQVEALGCGNFDGYHARIYPGMTHDWGAFRRGLRDFAQLLFR